MRVDGNLRLMTSRSEQSVVVTGMGAITALGPTLASTWMGLARGVCGIAKISRFVTEGYPAHVGAEVHDTGVQGERLATWRRGTQCFFMAAREALDMANVSADGRRRVACLAGLSVNYVHHGLLRDAWRAESNAGDLDVALDEVLASQPRYALRRDGAWQLAQVALALGVGGPQTLIDTACASSLHALVEAVRWIRLGIVDAAVVGGGCALVNPLSVVAFGRIGALAGTRIPHDAARPFDRRRSGFVLGEGGAVVVVERESVARARGARVVARIRGVGASTNATSMTDPSPGGAGEAVAIQAACGDAALGTEAVDLIVAHGTGTPKNDVAEFQALHAALGARVLEVPAVSIKGAVGHTLPTAGMLNVIAAVESLRTSCVPPTCGFEQPDPACPVSAAPTARRRDMRMAIVNAFAFGGLNASAIIEGCA